MRKIAYCLGLICLLFACKKETPPQSPTVLKGEIKGVKMGKLFLLQWQDSTLVKLDSVVFDGNGQFYFPIEFTEPDAVYLGFDRGTTQSLDNNMMVFVEPGETYFESNFDQFYAKAIISGSKNHKVWEDYKKITARYTDKNLDLINARFKAIRGKNEVEIDSIENLQSKMIKRKYLQTLNFVLMHKDFEIAPFILLSEIPDTNIKFLDSINNSLSLKVKDSKYGRMLSEYIIERKKSE
jgi:hypothetical protein